MLIDESQLFNRSTALWDTIIDCQDLYAELKIPDKSYQIILTEEFANSAQGMI